MKYMLHDKEVDRLSRNVAINIYNYAQKVFFGKAPIDVIYRMNYGSKGAEQKVLQYIWETYVEPKGDDDE